jgi:hypothetical protein
LLLEEERMNAAERLHQLSQGIYGGQINGLGLAAEGDDHLLALIVDSSAQAPDILVDAVDDPLEQALRIEFASIPKGTLDDACHLDKNLRSTSVQFARVASRRDPTT